MSSQVPYIVDGHVHSTNRVYWEGIDPWQKQDFGFDYSSAYNTGVRVAIENVAPYGYANFNYTPKQSLRLLEAALRVVERNQDRMALALTAGEARSIASSDRIAVVLGIESGFDHEGDIDVLRALYRLGLRVVQFSTQTCFNAFADSEAGGPPVWDGINSKGREPIAAMNELGILIDITHATPQAQQQIIEESRKPVVCSHTSMQAVSGAGMSDGLLRALSAKGGMVGTSSSLSRPYREWLTSNPMQAARFSRAATNMVEFEASLTPKPLTQGEFGAWLDGEMRERHLAAFQKWEDDPATLRLVASADLWAQHVKHVIETVGPEHVGIGLDLVGGRSCVPNDASGYQNLIDALGKETNCSDLALIAAENWLNVLTAVL